MITSSQVKVLQDSLKVVQRKGKLMILAVVSGVTEARLKEIIGGAVPTDFEYMTLDTLRGM